MRLRFHPGVPGWESESRRVSGDDLRLLELSHASLAPVVHVEMQEEGCCVATWQAPPARASARMDRRDALLVAAHALSALEFLHDSGIVLDGMAVSDVRLDGTEAVVAPFTMAVARARGEAPYGPVLHELIGPEGGAFSFSAAASFAAWSAQLSRFARRLGAAPPRLIRTGHRPLRDVELGRILAIAATSGARGGVIVTGPEGSGKSRLLQRVALHAMLRGARPVLVTDRERVPPALAELPRVALPLRPADEARLLGLRAGARGVVLLADDAGTLGADALRSLAASAAAERGITLVIAAPDAAAIPASLAEGMPRVELQPPSEAELLWGTWVKGTTPSARRQASRSREGLATGAPVVDAEIEELLSTEGGRRGSDRLDGVVRLLDDAIVSGGGEIPMHAARLAALGAALLRLGRAPEAVEALEEAVQSRDAPEPARRILAEAQLELGEARLALETLAPLSPPPGNARAAHCCLVGEARWSLGDRGAAWSAAQQGVGEAVGADMRARLLSLLACLAAEDGREQESQSLFVEALGEPGLSLLARARCLSRQGRCHKLAGGIRQALELYRQAQATFASAGDSVGAAASLVHVGSCLRSLGDRDGALGAYQEALARADELGDWSTAVLARFNRATLLAEAGRWLESHELLLSAAHEDEELGRRPDLAMDRCWLGLVCHWLGRDADARRWLEEAEQGFREAGESENAAEAALGLAERALLEGNAEACEAALRRIPAEPPSPSVAHRIAALDVMVRLLRGDPAELAPAPAGLAPEPGTVALAALARAESARAAGRAAHAADELTRGLRELAGRHLHYEAELALRLLEIGHDGHATAREVIRRLHASGAAGRAQAFAARLGDVAGTRASDAGAGEELLAAFRSVEALLVAPDPVLGADRLTALAMERTRAAGAAFLVMGAVPRKIAARGSRTASGVERLVANAAAARTLQVAERPPAVAVPLASGGETLAVVHLERARGAPPFEAGALRYLDELATRVESFAGGILRRLAGAAAAREIGSDVIDGIVSREAVMREACERLRNAAGKHVPVLLRGESGTGKELLARALHDLSGRRGAFVPVNMGAIPPALAASELFGARRGAYSGAVADRPGLATEAHEGTLFLDEIGDVGPEVQVALLRLLQEGEVRRVGDTHARKVDVRFVFATHKDLESGVREGWFREDLFYRINVVVVRVPPLRERGEDVPMLVAHLLRRLSRELAVPEPTVAPAALALLRSYAWPGNVRQLENVLTRTLVDLAGAEISPQDLPAELRTRTPRDVPSSLRAAVEGFEREYLAACLERCDGNRTQAAKLLGLSRQGLIGKLKALGIQGREPA